MAKPIISVFTPLPVQRSFLLSGAKIRGYGGAMGGGKSRTGCETVFDVALDHPGIVCLVARQAHTSIVETTKKTMLNQVIPQQVITRSRSSGGEDYVELWNGSRIHFVGLEDPLRWYSSEIGFVFFDEAQEIEEDTVLRIITRLRQRCSTCERASIANCTHMPNRAIITFNPGNPGHWLQRWFIQEGQRTDYGFYKPELWMKGATVSIGDASFHFALATHNPHLPPGYVDQTLSGMPEWMRRRYLEGRWEYISGNAFFDIESLKFYEDAAHKAVPILNGYTMGDIAEDVAYRTHRTTQRPLEPLQIKAGSGPLTVWKSPVRKHIDKDGNAQPEHRYIVSIDASSGRGEDFSAIQVIDIDAFEQVAEWQGKQETGLVAEQAYRIGRLYNNAIMVPEITGAWGVAIDQVLKRYKYPRLYTRRVIDRLSQKWTDRTGVDTTVRTRNMMLETMETVLREREFKLYSLRLVQEMGTFVYSEREKAEAQPGCNDDLLLAMAIGLWVCSGIPRQLKQHVPEQHVATFAATGY